MSRSPRISANDDGTVTLHGENPGWCTECGRLRELTPQTLCAGCAATAAADMLERIEAQLERRRLERWERDAWGGR